VQLKWMISCVGFALSWATPSAFAGPVTYTFTGTTVGVPSHTETFTLTTPDFLSLPLDGSTLFVQANSPEFSACSPCVGPLETALFINRLSTNIPPVDQIEFNDPGTGIFVYQFPLNALSNLGAYSTRDGWPNVGTLVVAPAATVATPEPSTLFVLLCLGPVAAIGRKRIRPDGLVGEMVLRRDPERRCFPLQNVAKM